MMRTFFCYQLLGLIVAQNHHANLFGFEGSHKV